MSSPCYYCELPREDACDVCIHGKADADDLTANARDAARYRWLLLQPFDVIKQLFWDLLKDSEHKYRARCRKDRIRAAMSTPSEKEQG